jgi:hypothetical protein
VNPVVAVLLVLPCIAGILVARTPRIRWIVGLALLAWIGLAVGIVAFFPWARAEVTLAYLPVAIAVIMIARRRGSRQLGLPEQATGSWAARILLAVATAITCVCGSFAFLVYNSEPFMPSADELLPLPQGLHANDITGDRVDSCGTGSCTRRFTITGTPTQSASQVRELLGWHLHRRGWELDAHGQDCRGAGWLPDRTSICISTYIHDATVLRVIRGKQGQAIAVLRRQ